MTGDFGSIRSEYDVDGFDVSDIADHPMRQFDAWFAEALVHGIPEANTMIVATVGDGGPAARAVLLKDFDLHGFVFFTNYESDKGHAIAAVPDVALCFVWQPLHRQVRVRGVAARITAAESDAYFASRPRGAQIAAVASAQSRPIADRKALRARFEETSRRFEGGAVDRPETWGGYRVAPRQVEFWQGQRNRLHDRLVYTLRDDSWVVGRLQP